MPDIGALRKKQPPRGAGGFEDVVQGFLALVMAKLVASEFEEQFVFARHPAWKNGAWKAADGAPVPAVAIGTPSEGLSAALEIETAATLASDETVERWRQLAAAARLDLVVPARLTDDAIARAKTAGVTIGDVWAYTIDSTKKVKVVKQVAAPEALVNATRTGDDIVVY